MPEIYMIFPEKCPDFTFDTCPKNVFPSFFFWGGGLPPAPVFYAHGSSSSSITLFKLYFIKYIDNCLRNFHIGGTVFSYGPIYDVSWRVVYALWLERALCSCWTPMRALSWQTLTQ